MEFKDYTKPEEIRSYLTRVLSRPGGKKEDVRLYHYTSIQAITSISKSGFIWLGSTDRMNDYLEDEFIKSAEKKLYFVSFSGIEENLAMYKMYAPKPSGAMLSISYKAASDILSFIPTAKSGKKIVNIVRDKKLTDETVEADVYWSAVCYKDLHTNKLKTGGVFNSNIRKPLTEPVLAGYVKLFGWEYEKEIRLCATTEYPLQKDEIIAIKLPEQLSDYFTVVTGPGFVKKQNRSDISILK